jgi:hypothetical protein
LISRNFSPDEIDFGLLRLQLIGVDIIIGAEELVELFGEIFWSIAHVYLHLVLVRMLHSERENETNLLLGAELLYRFFNEVLWLRSWALPLLLLNSDYGGFDVKLIQIIASAWILNGKEHFKVFARRNLSKGRIEVHGRRSRHPIVADITPVHHVPENLFVLDNFDLPWLHIKVLKGFFVVKLRKFVLEFRASESFDGTRY